MNVNNYKLVTFPNGAYGVQRGWLFGYEYYSFDYDNYRRWFELDRVISEVCYTTNYEDAKRVFELLTMKGM